MRVSQSFNLDRTQSTLDFVDVDEAKDLHLFIDPRALNWIGTTWGDECSSLIQDFFETVFTAVRRGSGITAKALLSQLSEPNEVHMGMSVGESAGRGLGWGSATKVYESLVDSEAVQQGLVEHLEETALMVEGIGRDIVSDMTANIIREPLIEYTQSCCEYYGMPVMNDVASGPLWDPSTHAWFTKYVDLPVTKHGKLLLVPKVLVRARLSLDLGDYYNNFLLPELQSEELRAGSPLVHTLKNGRRRVTKKDLKAKYGTAKSDVIRETLARPTVLSGYRARRVRHLPPLGHQELCDAVDEETPDVGQLLDAVTVASPGITDATTFHHAVEAFLSAIFYPNLAHAQREWPLHHGRKRVDITYTNTATSGFFRWLSAHYPSGHVFVECKNYASQTVRTDLRNQDLDQLSGRFSISRGQFGLLLARQIVDKDLLRERCRDTARDGRGYIVALDDDDLARLIEEIGLYGRADTNQGLIKERFDQLIS